jgi:hypothetical protein
MRAGGGTGPTSDAGAYDSSNRSISWIRKGRLGSVNESPGAGTLWCLMSGGRACDEGAQSRRDWNGFTAGRLLDHRVKCLHGLFLSWIGFSSPRACGVPKKRTWGCLLLRVGAHPNSGGTRAVRRCNLVRSSVRAAPSGFPGTMTGITPIRRAW